MTLEITSVTWSVDDELDDAITALVRTVVPHYVPFSEYVYHGEKVLATARNIAEAYKSGQAVYKDDCWLIDTNFDDAITALIDVVVGEKARHTRLAGIEHGAEPSPTALPRGPYSEPVYEAARNVAETSWRSTPFYFYRLTDIAEYEAELERRRQLGLTINPATAETGFWWVNSNDPYKILDEKYHGNVMVYEYFVRNPGASQKDWVHLYDLPRATRTAFRARDKRLIDLAEYEMEFERRRRIGVIIDPATAETASWWVDDGDPYGMLDSEFHEDGASRQYFVRNPGGEWVIYTDLPEATRNLLFFKAVRNEGTSAADHDPTNNAPCLTR